MRIRIKLTNGVTTLSCYSNNRRDKKCYTRRTVELFDRIKNKAQFKADLLEAVENADAEFIKTHTGRR